MIRSTISKRFTLTCKFPLPIIKLLWKFQVELLLWTAWLAMTLEMTWNIKALMIFTNTRLDFILLLFVAFMRNNFMTVIIFPIHKKFPMKKSFWSVFDSFSRYKSTMRLNITKIRPQDYGEYHCVSKNEMGIARAVFHLQGNDFSFLLAAEF